LGHFGQPLNEFTEPGFTTNGQKTGHDNRVCGATRRARNFHGLASLMLKKFATVIAKVIYRPRLSEPSGLAIFDSLYAKTIIGGVISKKWKKKRF
jgi:hypothetical protein